MSWGERCSSLSLNRPILQMPFVYEIPDSAYVDGKGQYDVGSSLGLRDYSKD